jgi:hypothetical protein
VPTKPIIVQTVASTFTTYVQKVEVYDTVLDKLRTKHPREYEKLPEIYKTIEGNATHIHRSKTHDSSIVMVNQSLCDPNGDPLRIPVKVFDDGTGIMSSAYFSAASDHGELLWSEDDGPIVPEFKGRKRK